MLRFKSQIMSTNTVESLLDIYCKSPQPLSINWFKQAPLVYLDQNELYMPSDIQAQLNNSNLDVNYTIASKAPSPLSLSNLEQANAAGNCTSFSKCPLYLTSKDNVTSNPAWLYGVLPDPTTYETPGIKSCAIISHDHGDGVVDAYYMYFYAFNLGENINGQILGKALDWGVWGDLEYWHARHYRESHWWLGAYNGSIY